MTASFFRLYFLLAIAVVGASWSIERIWQYLEQTETVDNGLQEIHRLIEWHLSLRDEATWAETIAELNAGLETRHELLPLTEVAGNDRVIANLARGEIVPVRTGENERLLVKRVGNSSYVLAYRLQTASESGEHLESLLLACFYLIIALVLLAWVWPLHRDLRRLEVAALDFGRGDWRARADIRPGSALFSLTGAFNHMAERISELVNAHKELTNAVSHEFRTPLARMRFSIEAAREQSEADATVRALDDISLDVDALQGLVDELLEYAAIERRGLKLKLAPVNFDEKARKLIARLPNERDIAVCLKAEFSTLAICCDWNHMERLLQNLLVNALRFANEQVRVGMETEEGFHILRVEDDGPGIPVEERRRVLEPFARIEEGGTSRKDGFGIGLAIVHRIAELHGGRVHIDDSPLGGALVEIRWPSTDCGTAS